MKKHLYLFLVMAIGLSFLAGCVISRNTNSTAVVENAIMEPAYGQPERAPDWEPTSYKTVNNFKGVVMNVKEETASPTGLTVVFANRTQSDCIFGQYYCLEKKVNKTWFKVPITFNGNYAFTDIGHSLTSGSNREWTVDWGWLYGRLNTGKYRIVKGILDFRSPGDFDTYYLAAEFTL